MKHYYKVFLLETPQMTERASINGAELLNEERLAAWTALLSDDLRAQREQLQTIDANAQRNWQLRRKLSGLTSERQLLIPSDRITKAIDRRYPASADLDDQYRAIYERAERLEDQLAYAVDYNTALLFADEVGLEDFRRYIPAPGQLGGEFFFAPTGTPTKNPEEAASALNRLPFVNWGEILHPHTHSLPKIVLKGPMMFPTERIIGLQSFRSWAGRGQNIVVSGAHITLPNGKGDKGFRAVRIPGLEQTSRGAITEFAQWKAEEFETPGEAWIQIVRDTDGEFWGMAHLDGSHRVGASKLRGDLYTFVDRVEIDAEEEMGEFSFSVMGRFVAPPRRSRTARLTRQAFQNVWPPRSN